ncbi:MAG: sulfatase-like hydrolase/transferase [Rhodobacterales bacterium]|nr:sulfatase-like hydrolase/transferase [Rhodobacterales bacterium]
MPKWTRREFTRDTALLLAATGCGGGAEPQDSASAPPRPKHVILITADDLGWRDVHSYGLTQIATPAMDRLVAEGIAFDRAFDVVSSCSSSRASFITGQYPHTHGVEGLVHRHPEMSLPTDHPTMIQPMVEAGFNTAIQGKWHVTDIATPEQFGYHRYLPTDIDQVMRHTDDAIRFIDEHAEDGFYLELNTMQTHRNLLGQFIMADGYEVEEDVAIPPEYWGLPDWPEIRFEVARYLSQVRYMDALIGEVLDHLDEVGLTDDTLIVLVSDNGPPFPGCKMSLYDRGTGTPVVFRWPAGLAPSRTNELFSTVDLAPTLLDLLGLDIPNSMEGRSFLGLFEGDANWVSREAVYSEMEFHAGAIPTRAVRTEQYKYIRNLSSDPMGMGDANGQPYADALAELPEHPWLLERPAAELYDLAVDPLERTNLIDDPGYADVLETLRTLMIENAEATRDPRAPEL